MSNLKTDILVESMQGVEDAKAQGFHDNACWHTSSAMVIERLSHWGWQVCWLEDLLPDGLHHAIGFASYDVANNLLPTIQQAAVAAGLPNCHLHIVRPLQGLMSILIYRECVYQAWLAHSTNAKYVAGDPDIKPPSPYSLSVGRFDTLYAALAKTLGGAEVIISKPSDLAALSKEIDAVTSYDRVLSLMEINPGQILHRLLAYLLRGRRFGLLPGPTVRVLKDNELIREMLPHLLLRGQRICYEKRLSPGAPDEKPIDGLPDADAFLQEINAQCSAHGIQGVFPWTTAHAATRFADYTRSWGPALRAARERLRQWGTGRQVLLSNTVKGPAYTYLAHESKFALAVAEHGVSAGLSLFHEPVRPCSEAAHCDRYLACSSNTVTFFNEAEETRGKAVAVGLPMKTRRIPLRRLQRFVARKRFKASAKDVVALYVGSPSQCNIRFLPYFPEDRDIHLAEKLIIEDVLPAIPCKCVIKFYNSRRMLDMNPFQASNDSPSKLLKIHAGDFRYLRAGADYILVHSPLSTLGWAFGADKPLFYIELSGQRLREDIRDKLKQSAFYFDTLDQEWAAELTASISRPHKAVLQQWKSMAANRKRFIDECLFGPKRPGKNAARSLLELLNNSPTSFQRD